MPGGVGSSVKKCQLMAAIALEGHIAQNPGQHEQPEDRGQAGKAQDQAVEYAAAEDDAHHRPPPFWLRRSQIWASPRTMKVIRNSTRPSSIREAR